MLLHLAQYVTFVIGHTLVAAMHSDSDTARTTGTHDACLVIALRNLGVPLSYQGDGPFRAMEHGNQMLASHGLRLNTVHLDVCDPGRYIMWRGQHFTAIIVAEEVIVYDGPDRQNFRCMHALMSTVDDTCLLFELGVSMISVRQRMIIAANRVQAIQRVMSRHTKTLLTLDESACIRGKYVGLRVPLRNNEHEVFTVPASLSSFDEYHLECPSAVFLQRLHYHPLDRHLTFDACTHTYYIDGVKTIGSVTSLIHEFTNRFDADRIIQLMRSGSNWPRPGYLRDSLPGELQAIIMTLPDGLEFMHAFADPLRNEQTICRRICFFASISPAIQGCLDAFALSTDDIKQQWHKNGAGAAAMGTFVHLCFEHYLNRNIISAHSPEVLMFFKYIDSLHGVFAYRTEWMIFAPDERLAGSIDFVAMSEDGKLIIYDWKRSKKLGTKYSNMWQNMFPPLESVPDCAGWHYRLQLNIYRYILQKYYCADVVSMFVVCVHPDNGSDAFVDEVPVLDAEIALMMQHQRDKAKDVSDPFGCTCSVLMQQPICF